MKTRTIIMLALALIVLAIVLELWYHDTGHTIKWKDNNTISYYNDNRTLIHQMLDTLKVLHARYPSYSRIFIGHPYDAGCIFLSFVFSDKDREERVFYNYSFDSKDSCVGVAEETHYCHKFSDSTASLYEDSCKSCSGAEKKMNSMFLRDSCLWHAFTLVKRSHANGVGVEKNGFRIIMDGRSVIEHGEGEYAFMYIPYSKKLLPDEKMNVTATIDSEVYLYHTGRN